MKDTTNKKLIVIAPGAMKPFHDGHYSLIKSYVNNGELTVSDVIIIISQKERSGVSAQSTFDFLNKISVRMSFDLDAKIIPEICKGRTPITSTYYTILNSKSDDEIFTILCSNKGGDDKRLDSFKRDFKPDGKYSEYADKLIWLNVKQNPLKYIDRTDKFNGEPISAKYARIDVNNGDFENFCSNYRLMLRDEVVSLEELKDYFNVLKDEVILSKDDLKTMNESKFLKNKYKNISYIDKNILKNKMNNKKKLIEYAGVNPNKPAIRLNLTNLKNIFKENIDDKRAISEELNDFIGSLRSFADSAEVVKWPVEEPDANIKAGDLVVIIENMEIKDFFAICDDFEVRNRLADFMCLDNLDELKEANAQRYKRSIVEGEEFGGYQYFPKSKEELKQILRILLKERGLDGDFNDIYTGQITDMSDLFADFPEFDGDISGWDVRNVEDMSYMFAGCRCFTGDISGWDVRNVEDMRNMFLGCRECQIPNWYKRSGYLKEGEEFGDNFDDEYDRNFGDVDEDDPVDSDREFDIVYNTKTCQFEIIPSNEYALTEAIKAENLKNQDKVDKSIKILADMIKFFKENKEELSNPVKMKETAKKVKAEANKLAKYGVNYLEVPGMKDLKRKIAKIDPSLNENFGNGDVIYRYIPKTKEELQEILSRLIKERGPKGDFNDIYTGLITDMSSLFKGDSSFNGDISKWDVSEVKNMDSMFSYCTSFNQDLSNWNVSNVENMHDMFLNCSAFNQDLSKWDVSNVEDMFHMFFNCNGGILPDWYNLWYEINSRKTRENIEKTKEYHEHPERFRNAISIGHYKKIFEAAANQRLTLHDNILIEGKKLNTLGKQKIVDYLNTATNILENLELQKSKMYLNEDYDYSSAERKKLSNEINRYKKLIKALNEEIYYRDVVLKKILFEAEDINKENQKEDPDEDQVIEVSGVVIEVKEEGKDDFVKELKNAGIPEDAITVIDDKEKKEEGKEKEDKKSDEEPAEETSDENTNESTRYSRKFKALLEGEESKADDNASEDLNDEDAEDDEDVEQAEEQQTEPTEPSEQTVKIRINADYATKLIDVLKDSYNFTDEEIDEYLGGEIVEDEDENEKEGKEDAKKSSEDDDGMGAFKNALADLNLDDIEDESDL